MTTTPGTPALAAGEAGPPAPEQLMAELVAWLHDMPAVRRALITSALANNRWRPTLADLCRHAVADLVAAATELGIANPYEYVANQLGVADADVDSQPITGDTAEHMQRLVRKLSLDADAEPAVQEVGEANESAPQTSAPH